VPIEVLLDATIAAQMDQHHDALLQAGLCDHAVAVAGNRTSRSYRREAVRHLLGHPAHARVVLSAQLQAQHVLIRQPHMRAHLAVLRAEGLHHWQPAAQEPAAGPPRDKK
jgi:Tfp pilus assembly PilM family ATPase